MPSRPTLALSFVLILPAASGCALFMPPGGAAQTAPGYVVPKESQDALRKSDATTFAESDRATDEQLDRLEKETLKAIRVSRGKEAAYPGSPTPEPSSTTILALRKASVKLRIERVTDTDGRAIADDYLQVKDSFTDRVQVLSRKMVEKTATPAEQKELQEGAKLVPKLNELKAQGNGVSIAAMKANAHVQSLGLTTMLRVAQIVRSRKAMDMEMAGPDYELVAAGLSRLRRAEVIAGSSMAVLATYQAVLGGADPKALDSVGDATLGAFPLNVNVTQEEAKAYADGLVQNVAKVKERYEAMMRKVHGDAKYERQYKAGIDAMFRQAETAGEQKSATEIAQATQRGYEDDLERCRRGEPIAEGSMVSGPTCKAARAEGPPSPLATLGAQGQTKPASGPAPKGAKLVSDVGAGLDVAQAIGSGDVDGAIAGAAKLFPGDSSVGASLQGIAALRRGDPKGAIAAAINIVPVPGLKNAFGIASKFF
jgi:hypothetical protein